MIASMLILPDYAESPVYRLNVPLSCISHRVSQIEHIKVHILKRHLSDIFWLILGILGKAR